MFRHHRGLCELGKSASTDDVVSNVASNSVVENTHASTDALVRARVWRRYIDLLGAAILENERFLCHRKVLAQEYDTSSTTNDEKDHCENRGVKNIGPLVH